MPNTKRTYTGRTEYVNDDRAFELLKGSGLSPKLIYSYDCEVEMVAPEGPVLSELMDAADAPELMRLFGLFCGWYNEFRRRTELSLVKVRFENFVLTSEGLVCTYFGCSRPGAVEKDIASAAAQLFIRQRPFSEQNLLLVKLFMLSVSENVKYDPDALSQCIAFVLRKECREAGVRYDETEGELLSVLCCMAGLVLAGGKHPVQSGARGLMAAPERFISITRDGEDVPGGFTAVRTQLPEDDSAGRVAEVLKKTTQPWTLVLSTGMKEIPAVLTKALMCAEKDDAEAVMVEAGGKVRDFPVLLRTKAAVYDLESGSANGRKTITGALARRPVKIVRLESLEVQDPHKEG